MGAHLKIIVREDGLRDWQVIAGNNEIVAQSNQGYTDVRDALRGWRDTCNTIHEVVMTAQASGAVSPFADQWLIVEGEAH